MRRHSTRTSGGRGEEMSDGLQPEKDTKRPEGVYCEWLSYPPGGFEKDNLLQIERVRGDCTVMRLTLTREEAKVVVDYWGGRGKG